MIRPLALLGRGEARAATRKDLDAPAQTALAAVRYADPASWTVAAAVGRALAGWDGDRDRVGVIAVSAEGPVEAMAAMCEASRAGSSSPIRFPASNAGSLAGIAAIGFVLRGPTLMLTLPPERGATVALLLADAWLRRGHTAAIAVAVEATVDGAPAARCLLLGPPEANEGAPAIDPAFLASLGAEPR
jgi:hypothetical protein